MTNVDISMTNVDISIIVPMYNAQETIGCCLESLLGQTYQSIEILVIDDGSTDESQHLVHEYAVKDARIVLLALGENHGVVYARQYGILHACGSYIAFVDSDDWCERDLCASMLRLADDTGADIVLCDAYRERADSSCVITNYAKPEGLYPYEVFKEDFYLPLYGRDSRREDVSGYLWMGLYKKELFAHVTHFTDVTLNEDEVLLLQLLHSAKYLCVHHRPYYHYNHTRVGTLSKRAGYWNGFWETAHRTVIAKEWVAQAHGLCFSAYSTRLSNYLYKAALRAASNQAHHDNPKSDREIEEYLEKVSNHELLDRYVEIDPTCFSQEQLLWIKRRKKGGLWDARNAYAHRYDEMRNLHEYISIEVLPYGV